MLRERSARARPARILAEGVRVDLGAAAADAMTAVGLHRRDGLLDLQRSLDEQVRLPHDRGPLLRIEIRPDDDVGDAGLVLEREEDEPFRGAGTLARDHRAGDADAAAVAAGRQIA